MGGDPMTFSGLAGMGDLVATCISPQSRNRHVGHCLGKGQTIDEIIAAMNMVAEGVKTSKVVMEIAEEMGVDLDATVVVDRGPHPAVERPDRCRR
jgi:glycerol-3-phosphate dehydrogenase (NAD(P)+)